MGRVRQAEGAGRGRLSYHSLLDRSRILSTAEARVPAVRTCLETSHPTPQSSPGRNVDWRGAGPLRTGARGRNRTGVHTLPRHRSLRTTSGDAVADLRFPRNGPPVPCVAPRAPVLRVPQEPAAEAAELEGGHAPCRRGCVSRRWRRGELEPTGLEPVASSMPC